MPATRSSLLLNLQHPSGQGRWDEFIQRYRPLIAHAVRRTGIPSQDQDDVIQSILLQLLKVLPTFAYQREKGFFRNWLRRIATNQALDWHRKQSRSRSVVVYNEALAGLPSRDEEQERFDHELLQAALRSVRAEFRPRTWECFEQRILQQKSAAQIASDLNLSENAVFINTSRVLSRVREFCHLHGEELQHDGHFQLVRTSD